MKTRLGIVSSVLLLMLCSGKAVASSQRTALCITNTTSERKLILVEDIDNYDWYGFSRPDRTWNGRELEAGETRCEVAEINASAETVNFSFVINGTDKVQKFRMTYVVEGFHDWMVLLGRDSSSSIFRGAEPSIYKNYEIGRNCSRPDIICSEFFVRDVP